MGRVCVYMQKMELHHWWELGDEKNQDRLVEWKVLLDTVGIKSADLKDKFLFWSFAAFRTD